MKIKDAIIIHGPGRSGTTLLNKILALHSDLSWISGYVNKYPNQLWLTYLNKLQSIHKFEKFNRDKGKYPRPAEAYNFWLHYIPNFNDLNTESVSKENKSRARQAVNKIMYYSGKKRFLTKITGFSRYQAIDAVFKNPTIIWMDRNPKAVIKSYYKQRWMYKSNIPEFHESSNENLLLEYTNLYKQFQKEKEKLYRFKFKVFNYEDLVNDKNTFFKNICEFTDLEFKNQFDRVVNSWEIKEGANSTYDSYFSKEEEDYLDKLILKL